MATMNQGRHDADNWTGYESGWIAGKTWAEPSKRSRGERHDADNWTGYESGWIAGKTWQQPAPRRMSRIEAAGHRVLAVTLAPLAVVIIVSLWAGWL